MSQPLKLSRRAVLQAVSVGTLVSVPFSRGLAKVPDTPPERPQLRLSASSINFSRLPIEVACRKIAELGFDAIDVWSAYAGCPHLDDVQNRLGAARLLEILHSLGLELYAFSVYVGGYPKYAELLGQCGGGVAIRGSTKPCEPADLAPCMTAFLDSLRPELDLAEKYDSYLAIENHGQSLLDSCESLKVFTDLNRHPRLGIALAPYHIQARGEDVAQAIRICGRQLLYFYAWQKAEGIQQLPGHGPADFRPWLLALRSIGYRGCVNPFMHGEPEPDAMIAALAEARDYLRRCWNEA